MKLRPVPNPQPRAVIYIRQSVERDESVSADLQEIACRDYAQKHGYDIVDVVTDLGRTGRTTNKRQINAVVDKVTSGDYQIILVWKWSRISRSRTDWAILADRVAVAGGRIESATEPIDTATASGRFARGVMTEYAAFQSEQIGEQWQEVHARRVKLGLPPTGSLPWGWEPGNPPTITEANANIIRHMYGMYFEGAGLVAIANWLNNHGYKSKRGGPWMFASVRSCLESPFHAGMIVHNGVTHDGIHEPVIDRATYDRFTTQRRDRSNPQRPRLSPYLLSTICVCHCGAKRMGNISGRRQRSYVCSAPVNHPRKNRICKPVDDLVGEWVMTLDIPALTTQETATIDTQLVDTELENLRQALTTLNTHLALNRISVEEHADARAAIQDQIAALEQQLDDARHANHNTPSAYLEGKTDAIKLWPLLTIEEQQALLRSLVKHVTIMPDNTIRVRPRWGNTDVVLGSS